MPSSGSVKELYKIKTIASLTNFNPTLLRAWERRYGLLVPTRTATGHRLYTQDDLRVLKRVRLLLDQGRSIGEIVAQGRQRLLQPGAAVTVPPKNEPAPFSDFPELQRWSGEALEGALQLDEARIQRALDQAFASVSGSMVVEQVIIPSCRRIGQLWAQGQASVAAEHLLTACVERRLQRLIDGELRRGSRMTALCACFPEEQHQLPLLVVAYALAQLQVSPTCLGGGLPFRDLALAIQLRASSIVFLSVSRASLFEAHLDELCTMARTLSSGHRFIVGGGGVSEHPHLQEAGIVAWLPQRPLSELQQVLPLT